MGPHKQSHRWREKLNHNGKASTGRQDQFHPQKERVSRSGERGTAWFRQRWGYHASLGLEDLDFVMDWRSKTESIRQRRQKRGGLNVDSDWENEHGHRWHSEGASGRQPYSRVSGRADEDDDRAWFQSWKGEGAATSAWWDRFRSAPGGRHSAGWRCSRPGENNGEGGSFSNTGVASQHDPTLVVHLQALGLSSNVALTRSSLKAAFHVIAKAWHPDLHNEQAAKSIAELKFRHALEAYTELLKHVSPTR